MWSEAEMDAPGNMAYNMTFQSKLVEFMLANFTHIFAWLWYVEFFGFLNFHFLHNSTIVKGSVAILSFFTLCNLVPFIHFISLLGDLVIQVFFSAIFTIFIDYVFVGSLNWFWYWAYPFIYFFEYTVYSELLYSNLLWATSSNFFLFISRFKAFKAHSFNVRVEKTLKHEPCEYLRASSSMEIAIWLHEASLQHQIYCASWAKMFRFYCIFKLFPITLPLSRLCLLSSSVYNSDLKSATEARRTAGYETIVRSCL